jgi:hypothetical protein
MKNQFVQTVKITLIWIVTYKMKEDAETVDCGWKEKSELTINKKD